ncbi:MAG: RHS repeat-associated core domain-containing protein [Actinomycetota bacterium]
MDRVDGPAGADYSFDNLGRLVGVTGGAGGTVEVSYDGLDRIARRNDQAFGYNGGAIDPVAIGDDTYGRTPGGNLLSTNEDAASVAVRDRHGDVVATLNTNGTVASTKVYDPFGDPIDGSGDAPALGFQADYTDPVTGDVWMGARWYDPTNAQFRSRDTVFGELTTPISLNRYTYAWANPINMWDPDGRKPNRCGSLGHRCRLSSPPIPDSPQPQPSPDSPEGGGGSGGGGDNRGTEPVASSQGEVSEEITTAMAIEMYVGHSGDYIPVYEVSVIHEYIEASKYWSAYGPGINNYQDLIAEVDAFVEGLDEGFNSVYDNTFAWVVDPRPCIEDGWHSSGCLMEGALAAVPGPLDRAGGRFIDEVADAIPTNQLDELPGAVDDAVDAAVRQCHSFSAETRVLLASGDYKPISQIEVGDVVWATDPNTGEGAAQEVAAIWPHDDWLIELETSHGTIVTTEDHKFWNHTDQAWQQTQHFDPGDQLLTPTGLTVTVYGLDLTSWHWDSAYDITVNHTHTYYVATNNTTPVLVHNTDGPCGEFLSRPSQIAAWLEVSTKEVKDAIHEIKRNLPRGGPVRNPDVEVDIVTGEVYPKLPDGTLGDSIGNIFDELPDVE